jgi:hypothetical protein
LDLTPVLHILSAFAWMRWRVLLNSLERTGSRDMVGRMATAMDQLTPIVMGLVAVPSALTLAGLAGYAGWMLGQDGTGGLPFQLLRLVLLAASVLAIAGPFMLPRAGAQPVRLLLLPIPRHVLFVGQFGVALADPWLLLAAAPIVALPLGLAAAGEVRAAGVALAGGILLLAILATVGLLVTSAIELTMRNRRRGELLALLLFLLVPVVGVITGLGEGRQREARQRDTRPGASRPATPPGTTEPRVLALAPSEAYAHAVRVAARAEYGAAAAPLLWLAGGLVVLQGLAFTTFARVLASPGVIGSRGVGRVRWMSGRRLPGLSPAASAIAVGQLRTALRTPRGRFTLLSPLVVFALFAMMLLRSPSGVQFAFVRLESGIGLAVTTSFLALLSVLPFAMNQFAVDRAGLTLALLAPLDARTLLAGKAAGNALVSAIPASLCIAAALALFPSGNPALWACVPLALTATYLLTSPLAAALSIVFPRAVDLNSIGRGSNAHGAAGLLGTLACAAAGGISLLLVLAATVVLRRPALAPLLLVAWVAICGVTAFLLFRPVATLFERRREDLGLLR